MRYTIEIDSPDMEAFVGAVEGMVTQAYLNHLVDARQYGRGSQQAILAGRIENCMVRVRVALKKAIEEATPDKAAGSDAPVSLQAGDEMSLVYGRPRRKLSNAKRKTAGRLLQ